MKDLAVIIVAGGSGQRMGAEIPKQFLPVGGVPILVRTLLAFSEAGQRILVLPQQHIGYWERLLVEHEVDLSHEVVCGGASRFQSVRNGLAAVDASLGYIAVHDGVRPYVSRQVIMDALDGARSFGAAIPVISVTDTVRLVDSSGGSSTLPRDLLRSVQTPQIFSSDLLLRAYSQDEFSFFTDDASVVEHLGYFVSLSEGCPENIKITYPRDLL